MFQIERKCPIELILFFSVTIYFVSAQDSRLILNVTANGELGKTAVISCLLSQENVTVMWEFKGDIVKNGERIKQDNQTINLKESDKDGNKIKNQNFTLTISNTTLEDVGDYVCIAGEQNEIVYLNLSFPAKFIKSSPPVQVVFPREGITKPREGGNKQEIVSLSCIFEVYNTTNVTWLKKDEDLTDKAITNLVPNNPKQIESIYNFTVSNADTESGAYKCEIIDPLTQKRLFGEINVTIFDKPTIAIDKVVPISPTELFVKWNVSTHTAPVQNYTLSTLSIGKDNIRTYYNKVINPNNTSVIVGNLLNSTRYKVKVSVTTEYGTATNESEIVTTLDTEPNLVPNISIKGFSATSVTIGWEAPSEDVGKLIHYYVLEARKKNENDTKKAYHPKDSKNLPYMFDDLEPHSTYIFKVCAGSEYFTKTTCSNEMEAATLDGIPGAPSDFHAYCGPRHMNLTWERPLKPNAEIKGYTMELSGTSLPYRDRFGNLKIDEWGPLAKFKTNDSKEARFEDLQANTNYTVRLSALTRTRKRGEEVVWNCTTDPAPPDTPPRPFWRKVSDNSKYMFKLHMPRVSERNGPVCCYRIYMIRLPHHFDWNSMPLPKDIKVHRYNDTLLQSDLAAYITDVFSNDEFPDDTKLIMGDGYTFRNFSENKNCSRCRRMPSHDLPQQDEETTTALPEEDMKREVDPEIYPEDGPLDTSHNYTLFVELIPGSEKYEPMYSEYLNVLMPAAPEMPARPLNKMEIALQVTCAIAAAVLLGMLIFCIMQTRKSRKMQQAHMELNPIEKFVRIIRGLGGQQPLVSTTPPDLPPIAKEDLAAAYAQRQADSDYEFQKEFELLQLLPDCYPDRTTHASEARENQSKNRYPDIKAYDQTRVKLSQIDSITGSDYINANYVMGYQERKQFICAQGPTDTTVNDFWRMIWEHGLELIVMLTNLEEYSKVKCSKYWPDEVRGSRAFGNITVHHVSEKRYSDYIVRELKITKHPTNADGQPIVENNGIAKRNGDCKDNEDGSVPTSPREFKEAEARTVRQYHFLVWKDFAAPEHPHSILKFIKRVNEAWASLMGRPVVVHCSAGVGRTGTLVALDCLLDQLRDTGHAAVFNTVAELRRQRNFLVQSLKQYVFVYRALVEYAHYGDTEIPASRLKTSIDRLRNTPEDADKCLMEHEFEKMINSPVSETVKSSAAGASEEVRSRNRSMDCLPYDRNRVILTPIPTREFSTYINASFIEAYDNSEGFIITQDPLPSTIMDFWRMVSEHNVSTIVMLSEMGEGKCPRYWDDGTAQYEHISVQYEESESCPYYTRRQFRVSNTKNGEVTSVLQLQYQGWPTAPGHVPEVTRGLAELADAAQPPAPPPHALARPMLVHCQYGTERSSLFVALCILIRQLRVERRVDVNSVARKVRSQRAHTIDTFLQYEFLHRAILNYAELHNLLEDS